MASYINLQQYRRVWQRRANEVVKAGDRSSLGASIFMMNTAKRLAPRLTGETIKGISKHKLKSGRYIVQSKVSPKGSSQFRQNLWANRSSPWAAPRMVWNQKRPTRYGDGSHRISGTPRFFHFAAEKTRRRFNRLAKVEVKKALRVTV